MMYRMGNFAKHGHSPFKYFDMKMYVTSMFVGIHSGEGEAFSNESR